ncbi:MAG: hypothetical protein ACUVV3_08700 [Dehalococcoidia bacterium]
MKVVSSEVVAGMEYLGAQHEVRDDLSALLEGTEDRYSSLQLHFLRRLSRLLCLRQQQKAQLKPEALRLLDRAIFATYRDCTAAGVAVEAQKIVQSVGSHRSAGGNDN